MAARKKRSKRPSVTRAESLLKATTFFTDRCLGAGVCAALRAEGWQVELHQDHFQDACPDSEWIPDVAARGWVILTKDKRLRYNEMEKRAINFSCARVFTLPKGNLTGTDMASLFKKNGLKMARFMRDHQPPFVANVTSQGVKPMELSEC